MISAKYATKKANSYAAIVVQVFTTSNVLISKKCLRENGIVLTASKN